jgi:hypothetical protein
MEITAEEKQPMFRVTGEVTMQQAEQLFMLGLVSLGHPIVPPVVLAK